MSIRTPMLFFDQVAGVLPLNSRLKRKRRMLVINPLLLHSNYQMRFTI